MADGSQAIATGQALDWLAPDYTHVYLIRLERLRWLRAAPGRFETLRAYYRAEDDATQLGERIADFINDWGMTFDPRNADLDASTAVPFLLFPKQREFVVWFIDRWKRRQRGLTEKSRDMGVSWLCVSVAASVCLLFDGIVAGFGSRTEDDVDLIGQPDCLFWKARFFVENLPGEFTQGWNAKTNSAHMRLTFPATNSAMVGDAGKNIGRGGRSTFYVVDESASLEHAMDAEASLSNNTNCRLDVSTPRGRANIFAQKRFEGKIPVFTFHWRQDPRKDDAWYAKMQLELDPVTLAQEVDLNYDASVTGVLIPSDWVQSAIGAAGKLGIEITGAHTGALDVADEGVDKNAYCHKHGIEIVSVTERSGKGSDIFETVIWAFGKAEDTGADAIFYDADGLGAGVRGDARVINEARETEGKETYRVEPFRGSGAVFEPEKAIPTAQPNPGGYDSKERKNKDFFLNAKSQGWWDLRVRFQRTHRAVQEGTIGEYSPDDLISLRADMAELPAVMMQLSQVTYSLTMAGKVVIDKQPDGTKSPNHADTVMIATAPRRSSWLSYLD